MLPIEADMHGMFMEDVATIMHTPTISAYLTESISACTTAGTEAISGAHAIVLHASLAILAMTTGESAIAIIAILAVIVEVATSTAAIVGTSADIAVAGQ